MTLLLENWTPDKVAGADDPAMAFADYCQQTLGVPWPTIKDQTILRKKIREFFEHYPQADYYTLCRIVEFARTRRRRYGRVWAVVEGFRDAFEAGFLKELDPRANTDLDLEVRIELALEKESDPEWRRRLICASGVSARQEAYAEWSTHYAGAN